MAEKKQKHGETKKSMASGTKKKKHAPKNRIPESDGLGRSPIEDLLGRKDQIGSILNKGLDLAEAGIGLGINLVSQLGSMVQGQAINKIIGGEKASVVNTHTEPENTYSEYSKAEETGKDRRSSGYPDGTCIKNRMPIFPGNEVNISFSINNDSPSSTKKLKLGVEGFIGEEHQFKLDHQAFSVHPSEKAIAPMDFDKFTLTGKLPKETPEDSYNGWIIISGEKQFRIPVTLIVIKRLK